MAQLTYGEIVKILEDVEILVKCLLLIFSVKFSQKYPHIVTSRPSCLFDSINRIAAPTRPSAVGPSKLNGSPLRTYLKRTWVPRTRNVQGTYVLFSYREYSELSVVNYYGLALDDFAVTITSVFLWSHPCM